MHFRVFASIFCLAVAVATPVQAQTPPLTMIVPAPAGSAPDIAARLIGDVLRTKLGQAVVIDNKPGAGGIVASMAAKQAKPDGHTLLFAQAAVVTVTPLTYRAASYDMDRDFEPVAVVAETPMLFVANPAKGPKSLAELRTWAKDKPDSVPLSSTSRGSIPHLSAELLALTSGVQFNLVPMTSSPQALQAVVSGDTVVSVDGIAPLLPHVRSGRLRALGMTADRPLPGLEDLPLAKDSVPGMVATGWFMLFAPKGTPVARVERLNAAVNEALKTPDVVSRLQATANFPVGGSVAQAREFLRREQKRWADAIQRAGLQRE